MQELFTPDEVAARLGLHVRTVRNYIRDGRLKAVRIGKQYRIARADLELLTGAPAEPSARETTARHRRIAVSSVIEIDAVSPETASRVSNLLTSATAHDRGSDERLHLQTIYNETRAHLKVVVIGDLETSTRIFDLVGAIVKEGT